MMDFLHRLAPPRETDASRAVAVLPSRFAGDSPLRAAIGQPRPMQRMDDEDPSVSLEAAPAPDTERGPAQYPARARSTRTAAPSPLTAENRPMAAGPRSHAPPREPGELPLRREGLDAPRTPHSPARPAAPDFDAPSPLRAVQHRLQRSERAASTAPSTLDVHVAAPTAFANNGHHSAAAPAGPVRAAAPLSEVSLAQRVLHARDERPVIHVTIDRIDVRAPAAPQRPAAPARPRATTPSVSLSDYLRGGSEDRR